MTSLRQKHAWIIFLLGLLSVITPFAIDMYLSAFSRMSSDFKTSTTVISLSLSSYFIGFAIAQILYGRSLTASAESARSISGSSSTSWRPSDAHRRTVSVPSLRFASSKRWEAALHRWQPSLWCAISFP
jgi:MFS family permease